ncbi:putative cytosolic protein [Granulibacter bethesdensis]|nr:putative cytosolic protein [Granulibacter bethesdensis]
MPQQHKTRWNNRTMSPVPLYTIGYEKTAQRDVIEALLQTGVKTLIDVRDRPLSRRAGFSKTILANSLAEHGISYVHLRPLGTPPEGREANKRRDWPRFWSIVDEKLITPEAEMALQQAATLAGQAPCCLLCYETDPHICHRLRVGEVLQKRHGFQMHHLFATGIAS